MNYFELYGLNETLTPDLGAVKKRFYELSRQFHPDRFSLATPAEQLEALRLSALNNDAYKTLNDPDRLIAYVLKLHGLLEEEEKYSLPPAFLMEMMELNEAVSEAEMGEGTVQSAIDSWQSVMEAWNEDMSPLLKTFDSGKHDEALLLQIKDRYFRKKYLLRIQERIDTFATRS